MICISRETDYACRVLLHLALESPNARVTAREVARQRLIPRALVRRVATRLANARLITTTRGMGGGMALARPAAEISLLDVVQAMEGSIALNPCTLDTEACPLLKVCPVHKEWTRARRLLVAELRRATFDKLAQPGTSIQRSRRSGALARSAPASRQHRCKR